MYWIYDIEFKFIVHVYRMHWKWLIWSLLVFWPCLKVKVENVKHWFCLCPIWSNMSVAIYDVWVVLYNAWQPPVLDSWFIWKQRRNLFGVLWPKVMDSNRITKHVNYWWIYISSSGLTVHSETWCQKKTTIPLTRTKLLSHMLIIHLKASVFRIYPVYNKPAADSYDIMQETFWKYR